MTQTKVYSVFNSYDMQKFFLLVTKQAEEYAYSQLPENTRERCSIDDFLEKVKITPALKKVIQDMVLLSLSGIDWAHTFNLLEEHYIEINQTT